MAEKIGDAFIEISARTKAFNSKMATVRKRFGSVVRGLAKGAAIAGAAIGALLVVGITKAIRAANVQEDAINKLNAVLRATDGAVGISSKALQAHAAELQQATKFGDETIINTQAILATFKEIKGDVFKDVTELALDMATVMGTDAKAAAIQLGKALNDPARNAALLSRAGIAFTDQQLTQIKVLQRSGDILGAQTIILNELKSEFEGVARAAGDTTSGAFAKLSNNVGDAFEELGFMITQSEAFRDILLGVNAKVLEFVAFLKKLRDQDFFEQLIMQARLFKVEFVGSIARATTVAAELFEALKAGEFSIAKIRRRLASGQAAVEKELATKRKKINDDFVDQVKRKTERVKEAERTEAQVVVRAEKEKTAARTGGFISASSAIRKLQEQLLKSVDDVDRNVRDALPDPGVAPAARPAVVAAVAPVVAQKAAGDLNRATKKAETQREKIINLLDTIATKEPAPVFG